MRKLFVAAAAAGLLLLPTGAFAHTCTTGCPAPCPRVVPSCYRTVHNPCLDPVGGVGRIFGHIFAPRCMPQCQPCGTCR